MSSDYPRKQPHEILGVKADADLNTLMAAFSAQMEKWAPEEKKGNELAAARVRRLQEAFSTMARQQGFNPQFDQNLATGTGGTSRDDVLAHMEAGRRQKGPERVLSRAEQIELFKMRARVGQLTVRWNEHVKFLHDRHNIINEIKDEQDLRFTRLKAIFRRSDEDRTLWAAESYLRAGGENGHHLLTLTEIGYALARFQNLIRFKRVEDIHQEYLELVEEAVDTRVTQAEKAMEIMKKQRKYIDFFVS